MAINDIMRKVKKLAPACAGNTPEAVANNLLARSNAMSILPAEESSNQPCPICQSVIRPKRLRYGAKYCSNKCGQLAYRLKQGKPIEIETRNCAECRVLFKVNKGKVQEFCSNSCRSAAYQVNYPAELLALSTGSRGAIGELMVCADLLLRGFDVFRAVSQSSKCDLAIVLPPRIVFRVEVTTGHRINGKLAHSTKSASQFDILAVCLTVAREIVYFSDVAETEIGGRLPLLPLAANSLIHK